MIRQAIGAYRAIASPESVTRIGLRFINRITLPSPDPELAKYFAIPPRFADAVKNTRMHAFYNRKEAEFSDKPIRIVVTFADLEPKLPESSSYLLDIDILWITPSDPILLDELDGLVHDMKIRESTVFEIADHR